MTRAIYGAAPGAVGILKPVGDPAAVAGAIELEIVKTLRCSFVPVLDGPTLLYHQLEYECIAIVNPRATSYQQKDGEEIRRISDNLPATTYPVIEARLLEPRRQFLMVVGDTVMIAVPAPGFACDAASGPFPTKCEILNIIGNKTFTVRWGIKANINVCNRRVGSDETAAILSHRWKQERDIDQDGFSTLIRRGHAVFDVGRLIKLGKLPDDFWLFLPGLVETGFRRDNIQVVATEDGRELEYCTVDRETPLSQKIRGISRIEATHTAINTTLGTVSGVEKGAQTGGSVFPVIGHIVGGAIGFFTGNVPGLEHQITVRIWGTRDSLKRNMELEARRMIALLLVDAGLDITAKVSAQTHRITRDVAGKWVELTKIIKAPALFQVVDAFEQEFGFGKEPIWPKTPGSEDVKDDTKVNGLFLEDRDPNDPNKVTDNERHLHGFDSTGSWLGSITAQALTPPCHRQPYPERNIRRGATTDEGGFDPVKKGV